jgi:Protein of unknown function (DUF4239)
MAEKKTFPPLGFLILGVLSAAASMLFVVRAVVVDGSVERILSAALFGAFGILYLVAYWSTRRPIH